MRISSASLLLAVIGLSAVVALAATVDNRMTPTAYVPSGKYRPSSNDKPPKTVPRGTLHDPDPATRPLSTECDEPTGCESLKAGPSNSATPAPAPSAPTAAPATPSPSTTKTSLVELLPINDSPAAKYPHANDSIIKPKTVPRGSLHPLPQQNNTSPCETPSGCDATTLVVTKAESLVELSLTPNNVAKPAVTYKGLVDNKPLMPKTVPRGSLKPIELDNSSTACDDNSCTSLTTKSSSQPSPAPTTSSSTPAAPVAAPKSPSLIDVSPTDKLQPPVTYHQASHEPVLPKVVPKGSLTPNETATANNTLTACDAAVSPCDASKIPSAPGANLRELSPANFQKPAAVAKVTSFIEAAPSSSAAAAKHSEESSFFAHHEAADLEPMPYHDLRLQYPGPTPSSVLASMLKEGAGVEESVAESSAVESSAASSSSSS